ncbi:glycine zipper 2TM domain-containing protein [Sphingomonas sp.]|jgi:hypothetical protein|uniref:glycine zipper 2TM domain-containing protein n=1 Tax=Sphingomonas sp. TaxID=28214 RepID=UPI002EDA4639
MLKQLSLTAAALAMGATALVPATASAQRYDHGRYERAYGNAYQDGYNRRDGYEQRGYNNRTYRGDRGYYRNRNQRCNSGTTGTIVGAIAGGLLGRSIDSRGDRATGTILGGAAGALAGRAVGRSNNPRGC